ncbi:MAG: hypothetical protein JSU04_15260 [Bdellovibrionales bacterium]|nr:hypothetical protein [Bdellovibrionales bacterium]
MKFFTLFFLSSLFFDGTLCLAAGGGTGDVGSGNINWIGYNSQCPDLSGEYHVLNSDGSLEHKTLKIMRGDVQGTLFFVYNEEIPWIVDGKFRADPKNNTKEIQWASFQCSEGVLYRIYNVSYSGFDAESYEKRTDGVILYKANSFDQTKKFDQALIPINRRPFSKELVTF